MKKMLLFFAVCLIAPNLTFANTAVSLNPVETLSASSDYPKVRYKVKLVFGNPRDNCLHRWPLCAVFFYPYISDRNGNSVPAVVEVYDDELIINILKDDIESLDFPEVSSHLIDRNSVCFGAGVDFPDELIDSMKSPTVTGIDAKQTYMITSDVKSVYIHVPL